MKQNYLYIFLIITAFFSISYFSIISISSTKEFNLLKKHIDQLEEKLIIAKDRNLHLRQQLARLNDKEYKRSLLAKQGYIQKDETLLEIRLPSTNNTILKKRKTISDYKYLISMIILTVLTTITLIYFYKKRKIPKLPVNYKNDNAIEK